MTQADIASVAESTGVVPVYTDGVRKLMLHLVNLKGFPKQKARTRNRRTGQYAVWGGRVEQAGLLRRHHGRRRGMRMGSRKRGQGFVNLRREHRPEWHYGHEGKP